MGKVPLTWAGAVKLMSAEAKKEGKPSSLNDVHPEAKSLWDKVVSGDHPKFFKSTTALARKSKKLKKSKKSKKLKKPKKGHKGAPSITRPGHLDFRTHKGDKYYHRDNHLYDYNEEGVVGTPYMSTKKSKKSSKKTKTKTRKNSRTSKDVETRLEDQDKKIADLQLQIDSIRSKLNTN
tara:strand:+ start:329 stop:862 length:534 start_codon:yes stop_codon:yes gene_type:complete